jgi:hypothetical protein
VIPETVPEKVGEAENTKLPLPVSFVTAAAKFADVGVVKKVATPVARLLIWLAAIERADWSIPMFALVEVPLFVIGAVTATTPLGPVAPSNPLLPSAPAGPVSPVSP